MIDPKLLSDTLERTLTQDDRFPARFYERLFAAHPELVRMFHRSTPRAQHALFAQKLTAIVDHVTDPTWLARELQNVARAHRDYGVTPEMYTWVGDELIATLAEACGEMWTPEAEQSWREAYATITDLVLRPAP